MKMVDISDEIINLPADPFISLVHFYASLEAMDHLQDRTGREVYISSNDLSSNR